MRPIFILAVVLLFASCSSTQFTSDYDKSTDFTKYKKFEYYGWSDNSDQMLNRFDKERIESAVGRELERRGYQYTEGTDGDMVVSLFIVIDAKTSRTAYTNHYGGGPYGYGWGWGMGASTTTVSEYDYRVGTFVIDVFDKIDKKLIWQGVTSGTVNEKTKGREERINRAVAKLMAQYPVKPLK